MNMNGASNFSNNSLFVGDLSKFCTESNLENLFAQFGQIVDVKIKRNNTTGKTLSYGFVYFANDECAARAMEKLNNVPFFGRNLRIRWAIHNAKAQKAPEESVINSVYVRFITPKTNEYVTEEAFHKVFDHFGSVVDVSIKESSVDQRTNRQSGYGFVHFSADNAGITAAFQAVSAVDNATIDGVTYNVELSKNLLKQFNEMNRANGVSAATSSPIPVQQSMPGMNPNASAYGHAYAQSPHSQSPHAAHGAWPSSNGSGHASSFTSNSSRSSYGSSSPNHPPAPPMHMQQHHSQQQRYAPQGYSPQGYSPQAYSPPPGQIMGMPSHSQPSLGYYAKRNTAAPITSLLSDSNLQSMYRDPYTGNTYGEAPQQMHHQHQQQPSYGRYLGAEASFDPHAGFQHTATNNNNQAFDPFQNADQYYDHDSERSHMSHVSGSRSSHTVSPLPGQSRRESEDFTQPQHSQGQGHAHHVRQGSSGSHNSHLQGYGQGQDGGVLHNADKFSAAYSPMSTGVISPMYDSDQGYGRSGASKPPPLNLSNLSASQMVPGGSVASSNSGTSTMHSLHSGNNSPSPASRSAGVYAKAGPSTSFWENDPAVVPFRGEKPPTPAVSRIIGAPSRGGGLPAGPGQLNLLSNSCSSGSTSQESTPTNVYAQQQGGKSPTGVGVAAAQYGQLASGMANLGISPSLPPSGPMGRSGLMSRSSSTSSATASTGVFTTSGNVSPAPGQYSSNPPSNLNSARKPAMISELEIHRSMSSGGSDRNMPTVSTLCTTDCESGFFGSNNSSFRVETVSDIQNREQQAMLASHIMLSGISLPNTLTDSRMELHNKQAFEPHGAGRENFHNEYFQDAALPAQPLVTRPSRINMHVRQLSLQSMSTIGSEGVDDLLEDEYTYSSASLSPKHSSSSLNLSGSSSFRLDPAFMLSPQSSTQSLETSPFTQYASESFGGRPPAGNYPVPNAQTSIYPPNATAPNMLRRSFQLGDSQSSNLDEEDENSLKDSRPVSLTSNDSSHLAGIAIDSSGSSDCWESGTEQSQSRPESNSSTASRRASRPEGIRLSKTIKDSEKLSIAEVADASEVPCDTKTEAADKGKRQLSLTQFFKPMARTAAPGEN